MHAIKRGAAFFILLLMLCICMPFAAAQSPEDGAAAPTQVQVLSADGVADRASDQDASLGEMLDQLIRQVFFWGEWIGIGEWMVFLMFLALPLCVILVMVRILGRKRGGGERIYRVGRGMPKADGTDVPPKDLSAPSVTQLLRTVGFVRKKRCPQYGATLLQLYRKGVVLLRAKEETWTVELIPEADLQTLTEAEARLIHVIKEGAARGKTDLLSLSQWIKKNKGVTGRPFGAFDAAVNRDLEEAGYAQRGRHSLLYRKWISKLPSSVFFALLFTLWAGAVIFLYLSIQEGLPYGWLYALILAFLAIVIGQSTQSHLHLTEDGEQVAASWVRYLVDLTDGGPDGRHADPDAFLKNLCYAVAGDRGERFFADIPQEVLEADPLFCAGNVGLKPLARLESATAKVVYSAEHAGAQAPGGDEKTKSIS